MSQLSNAEIKVMDNGPYIVTGDVVVQDVEGNRFETKEQFALCRCGRSQTKPFCDGAHRGHFEDRSRAAKP